MTEQKRTEAISVLTQLVGEPGFYFRVAVYDPANAWRWDSMAGTQRTFEAGETQYNEQTRRYSQLMRLTLHLGIIEVFKDAAKLQRLQGHSWDSDTLFTWFLKGHTTAFRANGWMDPGVDACAVNRNVRIYDVIVGNVGTMAASLPGSYFFPDPYMQRAAALARQRLQIPGAISN